MLLARACQWAVEQRAHELWLTTYAHLPWNAPFYRGRGFVAVPESRCGPQLMALIVQQKHALPLADQRIVMIKHVGEAARTAR